MELNTAKVSRLVSPRSTEVLTACRNMTSERLPSALKTVLDKVDDGLFELANKADSSQRQNAYFDAMRELRLKRDSFETKFFDAFNQRFDDSVALDGANRKKAALAEDSELSLVDSDEVEESLALSNFVESTRVRCKEQLFSLDKRMGYLLSKPDLDTDLNPVGPRAIGESFRDACADLNADIEVRLTLYKMFDKFASRALQQLYIDLNELLVKHDVLPKITATAVKSAGVRRTRVTIETEDEQIEGSGQDVFSTIQQLMSGAPAGFQLANAIADGGPAGAGENAGMGIPGFPSSKQTGAASIAAFGTAGTGATPLSAGGANGGGGGGDGVGLAAGPNPGVGAVPSTTQLIGTLTQLQQGDTAALGQTGALVQPAQIAAGDVNVIRALRETGAVGDLNQHDGLTLDIVSILFDYILDDPAIPDPMKALIGRLQIPMLKVALIDKALFSKKAHPARRLLDACAAAAIGWSETDANQDGLYALIDKLVHRIVAEFEDDVSLFESSLTELNTYLDAEEVDAERRSAESTQSLRTRERIVLAKMDADDAIKQRIDGLEVRAFIRQFLFDYWRQLLIITHVEHGKDSEIWHEQLHTVDELIWSLEEKSAPQDRKALTERLPQLLKNIKRGMSTLEMEPAICSKFLSMLASVHVVSVKQTQENSLAERHLLADDDAQDEPLTENTDDHEFVKQGLARLFDHQGEDAEAFELDLSIFDDDGMVLAEPETVSDDIMEFVDQVTELDLGDWVEFDGPNESHSRSRFTWISPSTGRYLFTSRTGQKALETSLTGLADLFANGAARRVETQPDPLFDRALGDLMNRLENQAVSA